MKYFNESIYFDEIIKEEAKSEEIILPSGFNERNNSLIHDLIENSNTADKRIRFRGFKYRIAVVLFITVLLFGSIMIAADYINGGDFFAQLFTDIANRDQTVDYSYMNTKQLEDISSSTIGTVVDTEKLKIEVLGVVTSGNTANIMLKVTAKELDSVLYDNGVPPLKNYRFNNEESSLDESVESGSIGYYYSDKDKSLEENQFKLLINLISNDNFQGKECVIKLDKFGYWDKEVNFVTVYDTSLEFNVAFDAEVDYSKELYLNQPIKIGSFSMNINSIKISPFACVIHFEDDIEYTKDNYDQFSDKVPDITLKLKDGTVLGRNHFSYSCGAGENQYNVVLDFIVPITVEDVESISLFGIEYAIE